jgi:Putative Flp pilus-assembly TadE/G-like
MRTGPRPGRSSDRGPARRASPSRAPPCGGGSIGRPSRWQAGSVTLVALALTVFVLGAGMMALDVGLLVVGRARAQTAADLAALAALTPAAGGPGASQGLPSGPGGRDAPQGLPSGPRGPGGHGGPAAAARAVAAANGAELLSCACGPTEAVVTVRSRVRMLPAGMPLPMTARARAVLPGLNRQVGAKPSGAQTSGTLTGPARGRGLVVAGWDRDGQAGWRWMRGKRHLRGARGGARHLSSSMHPRREELNL